MDSLIDSNEMLKDWECMTDLLLENAGPSEESLNDLQEVSLIELMTCCIKRAATGEPPIGRLPTRKVTVLFSKNKHYYVCEFSCIFVVDHYRERNQTSTR